MHDPEAIDHRMAMPWCRAHRADLVFGTSKYRIENATADWFAARATCEAEGTLLAVINDATENAFFSGTTAPFFVWIGLSDTDVEASYAWVDGSPLGYESWDVGEPDAPFPDEDCVRVNRVQGTWETFPCSLPSAFLCECVR